jgi:hypothetical protein
MVNAMNLSEQLESAMSFVPPDDGGLIVLITKLDNSTNPGQEMMGIFPIKVVGHEGLDARSWERWIRENAVSAYGVGAADRMAREGIDLRELDPSRAIGRNLRSAGAQKSGAMRYWTLNSALHMLSLVEKWPSLYNLIATEMAEESMTLRQFVDRMYQLPSPLNSGEGRYSTLGDLIGRNVVLTPSF